MNCSDDTGNKLLQCHGKTRAQADLCCTPKKRSIMKAGEERAELWQSPLAKKRDCFL